MSFPRRDRENFESLPPSCRAVVQALRALDGQATREELICRTGHSGSTMTDALRTLENRHWILRARKSDDLNQVSVELRHSPDL
jgi:DNA-binding MarR family transcriptional regulator